MKIFVFLAGILAAVFSANALLDVTITSKVQNLDNPYVIENLLNGKCSKTTGCYKNYCWSYCGSEDMSSGPWCYTTKMDVNSGNYVPCTTNEECNACWNCGGRCGRI